MRNLKYLFLSLGFLLIALGGINFYNQDYPPKILIFGKLYNFLHGREERTSYWHSTSINYNVSKEHNGYFYHLVSLEVGSDDTIFHFRVSKFSEANKTESESPEQDQQAITSSPLPQQDILVGDPFPNPVMMLYRERYADDVFLAKRKEVEVDEHGNFTIDIHFPEIEGTSGDIKFWCDYKSQNQEYNRLLWISVPGSYEPSGPNLWVILLLIGIVTFLIAAKINPLKSINKRIIETESELDYAKKMSVERVTGGKAYERLTPEKQYRYDTMMDYYNNAQNLIFESYKLYSEKSSFSFEIFFKSIVIIGIVFLFASILVSGSNLFLPDTFKLFQTWKPDFVYNDSGYLDERLTNLENAKFSLTLILLGVLSMGILATIATYTINVWKVRSVARSLVGKKLEKFSIRMRLEIENRTAPIDTRLISLGNKFSSIENSITQGTSKMNEIADSSKMQFDNHFKSEKKKINKRLKLQNKQFRTNLINIFRR